MNVYWFTIGDFSLRAYGTVLVLAFFLSMGVAVFLARSAGRKDLMMPIVDMSLWGIFGGLIGARLWHVFVFNWAYYSKNLDEIFKVWHGGLAIQGGLAGGLAVAVFFCYRKKINFWHVADICAPALILGQSIGRCANLLNGDGLGSPTGGDFGILYPPETIAYSTYGMQPLWPAEIWEGQIDILVFAVLLILLLRKWQSGYIFLFYVLMYSVNRFGLEFLRGDTPHWFGLSAAQWSALLFAVIAVIFLFLRRKAPKGLEGKQSGNDISDKKKDSDQKRNGKKIKKGERELKKPIAATEKSAEEKPSIINKNDWKIIEEDADTDEGKGQQKDWEIIVEDGDQDNGDADQCDTDTENISDKALESPTPVEIPPHIEIPVLKDSFKDLESSEIHSDSDEEV